MAENTSSKKSYGAVDDNKDEMAIEIQKLKLNSKTIQENLPILSERSVFRWRRSRKRL